MHTTQIAGWPLCFCSPGITMIWNWKMPSTQPSWHWRYVVYENTYGVESILTVSEFLLLLSVSFTLSYLCVSGEFWGSDDRGEHWGGDLQRGWLQKTHPSWGERLPGSHCVNTPSLVTGLSGHISRQRNDSTVANSLKTHFWPWNHIHSDRVVLWPNYARHNFIVLKIINVSWQNQTACLGLCPDLLT